MLVKRILGYGGFVALSAVLIYFYLQGLSATQVLAGRACDALGPNVVQKTASDFTLPDVEGNETSLSSLRGSVVLLHFWATWCPPCLEELPSLYRLNNEITDPSFKLLTVSVDDSSEVVQKFFADNRLPALPVLVDPSQDVPHRYGTTKYPESYLIDASGTIRYHFVNKRNWADASALTCIRSLLN